jgi:hypothetical protein
MAMCSELNCDDEDDDDGDGLVDCDDPDCANSPSCCDARCPLLDLGTTVGLRVAEGVLEGICSHIPTDGCGVYDEGSSGNGDPVYRFEAPASARYEFDAFESEAHVSVGVFDATRCEDLAVATRLVCSPGVQRTSVRLERGQVVLIVVDAAVSTGRYVLNIIRR